MGRGDVKKSSFGVTPLYANRGPTKWCLCVNLRRGLRDAVSTDRKQKSGDGVTTRWVGEEQGVKTSGYGEMSMGFEGLQRRRNKVEAKE